MQLKLWHGKHPRGRLLSRSHFLVIIITPGEMGAEAEAPSGLPSEMLSLIGMLDHIWLWDHGCRDTESGNNITSCTQTCRLRGTALGLGSGAFWQRGQGRAGQ